jgi:glycosyltransferase involved in cell wall biosynthesis
LLAYDELRERSADHVLLFDEFVGQRALGLLGTSARRPPARLIVLWELVFRRYTGQRIVLEVSPEDALSRAAARPEGLPPRLRSLGAEALGRVFAVQAGVLGALAGTPIEASSPTETARLVHEVLNSQERVLPPVGFFVYNLTRYSGAARQARLLADGLRDAGVDVVFCNIEAGCRRAERSCWNDLAVLHVPAGGIAALRSLPQILRFLREQRVGLLHLHGLVGAGLLAAWAAALPFVLKTTLLGDDDLPSVGRRSRLLLGLARRASANIALSHAIELENAKLLPRTQIHRLANGVAIPATPSRKEAPTFCTVGAIIRRKRTDIAIDYFLEHYADAPGARLYVAGPAAGEQGVAPEEASFLAECRSRVPASQREQVIFTGMLEGEELEDIYRESLGFLLFSEDEGMPNALLEAMSHNCVPVIGALGGVAREVVPGAEIGFVVGPDQPAPSLMALRQRAQAAAPHRHAAKAFGLDRLTRQTLEIYREIRASRSR